MTETKIMKLVGNLIDQWEQLPNDVKSDLESDYKAFHSAIESLWETVEPAGE